MEQFRSENGLLRIGGEESEMSLRKETLCRAALVALVILNVASPSVASAQAEAETKEQRAEALFSSARQLLELRQYPLACPKLEQSQQLDPAVGTLLYLAFCYEMTDRFALAWRTYRAAEAGARAQGQGERVKLARLRASLLEPKLALVRVEAACPLTDVAISLDEAQLSSQELERGVRLEPGRHRLRLRSRHLLAYEAVFEVRSGEESVVPLDCKNVEKLTRVEPGSATRRDVSKSNAYGHSKVGSESDHGGAVRRLLGFASGTIGVVALGIGTVYALDSAHKSEDAEKYRRSGTDIYDEPGFTLNREALESRSMAIVGFVVSGVALGGATVLLWPRSPAKGRGQSQSRGIRFAISPQSFHLATQWN
ncbi:MAG: hypothetical protein QM784_31260 [Polyangiaceae bacterium]